MQVPVGDDLFAIVDAEDYPVVSRHKWHASRQGGAIYAHRNVSKAVRAVESMHRMVMGSPPNSWQVADHIDGNGLNNSKSNLRFVSRSGNAINQRRNRDDDLAGIREVRPGRWTARMVIERKYTHLGTFPSQTAAIAAKQAAITTYFQQEQHQ